MAITGMLAGAAICTFISVFFGLTMWALWKDGFNGLGQVDIAEMPIAIWFVLGFGWTVIAAGARQLWHYRSKQGPHD
jgi:hypothetical protein